MTSTRKPTAAPDPLLALLLCSAALSAPPLHAQAVPGTPPVSTPRLATPRVNRNLIFLDPAHGGDDDGAHIGEHILEKDVTLALASRIRPMLATENITVLTTREADTTDPLAPPLSNYARAGLANHAHPVACVLLHATGSGRGVHIITSDLASLDVTDLPPSHPVPWDSAQAGSVLQSLRLASDIATSLTRAGFPVHLSHSSIRPINSLTCPAVAVEIAPLDSGASEVSTPVYQQRVAQALATALLFWRTQVDPNPAPQIPSAPRPSAPPTPAIKSPTGFPVQPSEAKPPTKRTAAPAGSPPSNSVTPAQPRTSPPAPIIRRTPRPAFPLPDPRANPANSGAPQ